MTVAITAAETCAEMGMSVVLPVLEARSQLLCFPRHDRDGEN